MARDPKIRAEAHREAMRKHRRLNSDMGRVDLRLGWGTEHEKGMLKNALVCLRDPSKSRHIARVISELCASVVDRSHEAISETDAAKAPNQDEARVSVAARSDALSTPVDIASVRRRGKQGMEIPPLFKGLFR